MLRTYCSQAVQQSERQPPAMSNSCLAPHDDSAQQKAQCRACTQREVPWAGHHRLHALALHV